MEPTKWSECPEPLAMSSLAELQTSLRRRGVLKRESENVSPLWLNRLGATADGHAWLKVEHPRHPTRPAGDDHIFSSYSIAAADSQVWNSLGTYKHKARWLWMQVDPKWHSVADAMALLLEETGPQAEVDRRRKVVAAEEEADREAQEEQAKRDAVEREKTAEAARRHHAWEELPQPERARQKLIAADPSPERRPLVDALADICGCIQMNRPIPMPSGWKP